MSESLGEMTSWVEKQEELKELQENLFKLRREECKFHCFCIVAKGYYGPTCQKEYEECCKCGERHFHRI